MKSKFLTFCLTTGALLLAAGAVRAGDMGYVPMPPPPPQPEFCFDQNLRSFDVYAGYRWAGDDEDLLEDGDGYTAGIGVNLFFNRYIGVGLEGAWTEGEYDYLAAGNLILRLPIDSICLAPYVFGGVGSQFGGGQDAESFWQVGAGLEYKMNEYVSLFGDGRYVGHGEEESFVTARGGLRFSF